MQKMWKRQSDQIMNLYFDTEFTGLHKETTLISIGIISEEGDKFYAELTDYSRDQVDTWINENVIANLVLSGKVKTNDNILYKNKETSDKYSISCRGDIHYVSDELKRWIEQFDKIEMWSDCLAYDWVLFNHLFGHAFNLPKNIYYIPFDICTLFKIKGIDPDISREEFINNSVKGKKHNSLYDAKVIKACYEKLIEI